MKEIDKDSTYVVINFAYPVTPLLRDGRLDGVLLRGMKENRFTGLVGQEIGGSIEKYILEKQKRQIQVVSYFRDCLRPQC